MKYIQVGVTALRTPDGGFLPSVPLYIAEKMKQYIEGGGLRPRAKPGRKPKGV